VTAGLGPPPEHALISLLALNGLRVSEATGADIEHLGLERGHRTLTITRKGGIMRNAGCPGLDFDRSVAHRSPELRFLPRPQDDRLGSHKRHS
jgi:integrase